MSREQIEQNAFVYILAQSADYYNLPFYNPPLLERVGELVKEAHIAGAESRQPEIDALNGLCDTYEKEIDKLRNTWKIFPNDIPNDGQEVILTWKKSGVILKALFQKEFVTTRGKLVKNIFRMEHEEYKGIYSDIRWHDESSVTFWMPIPPLK